MSAQRKSDLDHAALIHRSIKAIYEQAEAVLDHPNHVIQALSPAIRSKLIAALESAKEEIETLQGVLRQPVAEPSLLGRIKEMRANGERAHLCNLNATTAELEKLRRQGAVAYDREEGWVPCQVG